MGPDIQYVDEKPADPIDLRVYEGADGQFELYEDAGEGNAYRSGQYATIPFTLHGHTLRIGKRAGAFPNMLVKRTFQSLDSWEESANCGALQRASARGFSHPQELKAVTLTGSGRARRLRACARSGRDAPERR